MGNISLIHIHSTTGLAAVWTLGRTVVLLCLLLYAAHSGKAQTSAHDMQEPTLEEIYQQARKHKNKDPQKSKDYALRALRGGRKTGDSAYIGKVLNVLGAVEMSLGHQEKALVYLEEALGKGKGKDRAVTLTTIGTLYYNRCQFRKAKVYYEKALHVFRTLGNPNAIASCWSNIGLAYKGMYAYEKAVENYLKALSIKESLSMGQQGKVGGTDKIMNNIGEVYLLMGDDSTALEYFNKSLVLQERIGLEKNLVYTYTFIGSVYEHRGELHRALDRYKKALDISRALPFAEGQAFAATNLGITYGKLGDWQQAEQYQEEALHWNTQLSDPQSSARNWLSLAEIAYAKGRYRKALENIATAASLVGSEGTHHLHVDMYRLQADIAEHLGQYRQAYAYSKMEKALSDSLAKANNTQRIFQLRNNYASEKIALLEKDRELKVMQISKAKLFNNAAIAVAFLLVLVIFMLLRSHRRKMRNNLIIKAKNEEINRQKIKDLVWEQQIKSIQANIEGQESEKKRIAKELHDGLGATLSTIKLNLQRREGAIAKEEKEKLIRTIGLSCEEVRTISHHLSPPRFSHVGFTGMLKGYVDEVALSHAFQLHQEYYPEEALNALTKETQVEIYRMVQELLNNIVKHARADKVSLQLLKHEGYINLMIEDDGVGFDPENQGEGIGLINIRSRVKLLRGNFDVDSQPGRGTIINIDLKDTEKIDNFDPSP